jgi:hypothetical protein
MTRLTRLHRSHARPPGRVLVPARDATMLDGARWVTIAKSETTGQHEPLTPARAPLNAGRTVSVEWAGRCRACGTIIWASVAPQSKSVPRHCPDCRAAAVAAGQPVGPPIFRFWMVARQAPPDPRRPRPHPAPDRRENGRQSPGHRHETGKTGRVSDSGKSGIRPSVESRGSNTLRVTLGPERPLAEAGRRLRGRQRARQTAADRARACRARRRAGPRGAPRTPTLGGATP